MHKVVLLRHGQSIWNKENKFTGWTDVPLTEQGIKEAQKAGQVLKEQGYTFDIIHSNVLKRAIKTAWVVMEEMDLMWAPFYTTWRLNEKHYGSLQGLNKDETATQYGEDKVFAWRREYNAPPPPLEETDERHPIHDPKYNDVPKDELPATESLKTTIERTLPYWHDVIWPQVNDGKMVLVCASHNSLRGIVKHLTNSTEDEISHLNIPYGVPLVFEFDDEMNVTKHYYLGDQAQIEASLKEITSQGSYAKDWRMDDHPKHEKP